VVDSEAVSICIIAVSDSEGIMAFCLSCGRVAADGACFGWEAALMFESQVQDSKFRSALRNLYAPSIHTDMVEKRLTRLIRRLEISDPVLQYCFLKIESICAAYGFLN